MSAPCFFLRTPQGVEVSLASCLVQGPTIVEFIRGSWDPDARSRLGALAAARERLQALGARLLIITCERPGALALYLNERPSPLTIVVDEERSVARSWGILQRFSLPLWNVARPSTFVVDRCGFVRYAFVARLSIHSAPLEEVEGAIGRLRDSAQSESR